MSLKVKQKYAWGTETSLSRSLSKSAFFSCEEGVFSQEKWDNWNHGPYMELCNMVARTKRQRRKRCLLFMTFFGKIAITGSNVLFKTLIISILHEIACGNERKVGKVSASLDSQQDSLRLLANSAFLCLG